MALRVAVVGAAGRMGSEVCRAVRASDDLEIVATVSPRHRTADALADVTRARDVRELDPAQVDVAVEFTQPDAVAANVEWCLRAGIHVVSGTTGWSDDDLARWRAASDEGGANAVIAPNFALGAVLMVHLAGVVAPHMPHVEIVELHHAPKLDAPSGTARRTAQTIAAARGAAPASVAGGDGEPRGADIDGVRVHSVRLPGLVAHQEVIFGGDGETLTLRHDSLSRASFMPGVLLAVRQVRGRRGVTVGLEALLGLE